MTFARSISGIFGGVGLSIGMALTMGLSACSGGSGGGGVTPSSAEVSASAPVPPRATASPIDALIPQLSESDERTLWEAQRKLIRTCMASQGIDYTLPAWEVSKSREQEESRISAAVSSPRVTFGNPAWAKAHGYGFDAELLRKSQNMHLGPETGATLDARTSAVLYGDGSHDASIPLGGGQGKLGVSTTGCYAEMERQLFGDQLEWIRLNHVTSNMSGPLHEQVLADPKVASTLSSWRDCMASRGWPALKTQGEAYQKVAHAYWTHSGEAHTMEFSIAPADAECTVSSGYGVAFPEAEKRVAEQAKASMQSTILAFLELRARALTAATKILSS